MLRRGGVFLELFAKPPDVHIHRAVVACVGVAPDEVHQIFARVNAARILDKKLDEVVFLGRELDDLAVFDGDALLGVERDAARGQQERFRLLLLRCGVRAAQQRADARFEL